MMYPTTKPRENGFFKGGKREDLGGMYFRSSWEANWARYLNWMQGRGEIQTWDYERVTFEFTGIKRGSKYYTPDFRVTLPSGAIEFHEIKGWMDKRSKTKIKRMAKYHPGVRLIVIDKKQYTAMAKELRSIIKNWE